jgi:hypothetical protein
MPRIVSISPTAWHGSIISLLLSLVVPDSEHPEIRSARLAFAAALRAADYSVRGVRGAIGSGGAVSIGRADVLAIQSRLDRSSPLAALI